MSQAFARRHWPDASPLGQRLRFTVLGTPVAAEIVGVVGDTRQTALDSPAPPAVYVSARQVPSGAMSFVARTAAHPARAIPALQARVREVFPGLAIYRTAALTDLVARTLAGRRFMLALMLAFAVLAVVLAAIGVYGVMNILSAQRTREFGVRLALGADRTAILRMVMRQGALMIALGIGTGLAGAVVAGQVLRRFLFGIGPTDPWSLIAAAAVLGACGALACALPALRATRVSPLAALRGE